ncbi:MAG TPA: dephospho-CoA kinase [Chroococcales cyanobacterium]
MPDSNADRPYVIGVTGTIGSGKSTVGKMLVEQGVAVIDTDLIVHELLNSHSATQKAVVERFGDGILDHEHTVSGKPSINRKALGAIVFHDEKARKDLEAIVHPGVILECRKRIAELKEKKIVAVLVPLLFEAGLQKEYDEIWTVLTRQPILKERLAMRDKLSETAIAERLAAQWDQEKKASLSKCTIDNSGSPDQTRKQIVTLLDKLRSRAATK